MNPKTTVEFYQSLGKLFYAISAIDHSVKEEEFKCLETIIKTEWLPLNHDAILILNTFKQLQNNKTHDPHRYFQSFVDFKSTHSSLFDKTMNSKILKTASAITASFSGQNKSELILLAKLDLELKKGEP